MDFLNFIYNIDLVASIFFFIGFLLVIVEMFHPGFGAPGIMGGIFLALGVIFTARSLQDALIMIAIIVLILGGVLTLVLRSATRGRLSKSLILVKSQNKQEGYIGVEDLQYFVGREGRAATTLRPSGIADIDGVKLDVVSDGEYIQKGTDIRIVRVEGRRIVVKPIIKN